MDAQVALDRLIAGNSRFVKGESIHPNRCAETREKLLFEQKPFAVIVSCADSRIPPAIVFDKGLGDLFVIRNAGNVVNTSVIGSIEYAVAHLGTSLVVILGHTDCGAVKAVIKGGEQPTAITKLLSNIKPAIAEGDTPGSCYTSTINNVKEQAKRLKAESEVVPPLLREGKIKVVGGYYHLDTGKVDFFDV